MDEVTKSDEEWRQQLGPDRYAVLRQAATERPFSGKYVHAKQDGTYRCAACGAELFDASTQFDSGTGWPSFTEPKNRENVELVPDHSHGMIRTEVRCARCGGHLGHVFDDGPRPTGQRYCINSLALDLDPPAEHASERSNAVHGRTPAERAGGRSNAVHGRPAEADASDAEAE